MLVRHVKTSTCFHGIRYCCSKKFEQGKGLKQKKSLEYLKKYIDIVVFLRYYISQNFSKIQKRVNKAENAIQTIANDCVHDEGKGRKQRIAGWIVCLL